MIKFFKNRRWWSLALNVYRLGQNGSLSKSSDQDASAASSTSPFALWKLNAFQIIAEAIWIHFFSKFGFVVVMKCSVFNWGWLQWKKIILLGAAFLLSYDWGIPILSREVPEKAAWSLPYMTLPYMMLKQNRLFFQEGWVRNRTRCNVFQNAD